MKYRLYIDEVGNNDVRASNDPNHRYLSLTGVICSLDYVRDTLSPEVESLKRRYFNSHPDDPVIFHRKELINKKPPFDTLTDPELENSFNQEFLECITKWDYSVLTVVLDKQEHAIRYEVWKHDPYHYCLHVLLERYVMWLKRRQAVGDVLAESRGGKEDMRLKRSFEGVFEKGTDYVAASIISKYLTSKQLKVKPKSVNIAGLQLADVIAHPSYKAAVARRQNQPLASNFGGEIARILEQSKFDRDKRGKIDGWGRKWLP